MNRLLLLLVFIITASAATAQNSVGEIKLKVIDDTSYTALDGAVVCLETSQDRGIYKIASGGGVASFSSIPYGQYNIEATFMGYDTLRRTITVNRALVDLGELKMMVKPLEVDQVTVMGTAIRTSIDGDTVIYNADAFKVTADAVAEGLLAKMPGITVDDEGEVEAQGEEVKRVYLDGKEFFGEDVALAVKNIPADIIARVEVFNKLSDSAEFTGFDDGDSYKALNIVTKAGMSSGHFGKFTAGYAHQNLYQASASYNYFTADHRLTLVGLANNMNIKGFGSMDMVGSSGGGRSSGSGGSFGGSSSGISTITGLGVNYGGSFLEEKLKVEGSYFYNQSENEQEKYTEREYITEDDELQRFYDAVSETSTENYNHRVNLRFEYKPNDRHSIMMRPEFAIQDNISNSYSLKDNDQATEDGEREDLNDTESSSTSDKRAYNISNTLTYRALIGQEGRNIMVTARGNYGINDSEGLSSSETVYASLEDLLEKQNTFNGTSNYSLNSSVMYSEPIMDKSAMLTMQYKVNYRYSDADYKVYLWEQEENMFNPDYDRTSSNIYNSGYITHNVGPGFMYSVPKSLSLNASVSYQSSTLAKEQEVPVISPSSQNYTFENVVYSFMMRKTFNSTNTLRINLKSNTDNPSASQLQEVVKDSNPLNVTSGNSDLDPSYSHSLKATYNRSNITKGRTFMVSAGANLTDNYIGESTIMLLTADDTYTLPNDEELTSYGEYSYPVNLDGNWSVNSSVTYGTPINPLYCNLNFNFGYNYGETPSILNEVGSITKKSTYKAGASLGSNISQYADFTISYTGTYNVADYEYDLADITAQRNEYYTQNASINFKFVFWGGFTLSGTTKYTQYVGITSDFYQDYTSCNIYLGHKVFKNQRGEITLGVNDLFNNSESFKRNITETYVENVISNTIGRYYGIKFTYDLRNFLGSANGRGSGRSEGGSGRSEGGMGRSGGGMGGGRGGML